MKIKKKKLQNNEKLDLVVSKAKGDDENLQPKGRGKGRPKSKVKKVQCQYYLPERMANAIDKHCMGNKSVFTETVFQFYFESKELEY